MKNYDSINKDISNAKLELAEVLKKVAPDYADLTLDIQDVQKYALEPTFNALLLFKLAKEREQTNKILAQIEEKFDRIMFTLKSPDYTSSALPHTAETGRSGEFNILAEQDEKIMAYIEQKGKATANEIMTELNYKGQNAASQRMNLLFKQGLLKKVRAGKKVFFLK